jgi:hypothetical protein
VPILGLEDMKRLVLINWLIDLLYVNERWKYRRNLKTNARGTSTANGGSTSLRRQGYYYFMGHP